MSDKAKVLDPALIDELGELQRQADEFAPAKKRLKEVKDQIEAFYADSPADETFVARGTVYDAQVGVKKWERTIVNMGRLFALLKKKRFLELCSFALGDLDKESITETQLTKILVEEQIGGRAIKPILKAAAVPAKKAA